MKEITHIEIWKEDRDELKILRVRAKAKNMPEYLHEAVKRLKELEGS